MNKIKTIMYVSLILLVMSLSNANASTYYLVNFSSGLTGATDYTLYDGSPSLDLNEYAITTNPHNVHSSFASYGDHTPGGGNMMVINASTVADKKEWYDDIAVTSGQTYKFSFWISSAYSQNPASINVNIGGTNVLTNVLAPASTGVWEEVSALWTASSTGNIRFLIDDRTAAYSGDDFAIDDIKLEAVPIPAAGILFGSSILGVIGIRRKTRK